ncbi:hypothetical protein ACLMJK_001730 [Lecanora helva]
MPILWNVVKAFIIRNRLSASLPDKAKEYFHLSMDPAAGTVSVRVCYFGFYFSELVQSVSTSQPYGNRIEYEQLHFLGKSWMLLLKSGVYLATWESREPQKFLVNADMQTPSVELRCDWASFVLLALALDVDPYEGTLLKLMRDTPEGIDRELVSPAGGNVMTALNSDNVFMARIKEGCRNISPIKALAWISVMVVVNESVVNLIPLKKRYIEADLRVRSNIRIHPAEDERSAIRSRQDIVAGLIWTLYSESIYHIESHQDLEIIGSEGLLPVSQDLLNLRETMLNELASIQSLGARLHEIFPGDSGLIDQVQTALSHEWQNSDLEILDNVRVGHGFLKGCPPGYVAIWDRLQSNETFQVLNDNFNPLPTLRTRTDADLADKDSPLGLLARVIIALSSIQKWRRLDWPIERNSNGTISSCKPCKDPIEDLIPEIEVVYPASLI